MGTPLALTIPAEHAAMLRQWFRACIEGLHDDAESQPPAEGPQAEANADRLAEAEAFEQLLDALDTHTIQPTPQACAALADLAHAIGQESDYEDALGVSAADLLTEIAWQSGDYRPGGFVDTGEVWNLPPTSPPRT